MADGPGSSRVSALEGDPMIEMAMSGRTIGRGWVRGAALGAVVTLGIGGILAGSSTSRVLANPSPQGTQGRGSGSSSPAPQPPPKLTPQEARELMQALRQLRAAVNADQRGGTPAAPVPVARPPRSITPPTLTPAELDRLVARYLAQNDPKVEPAPLTTDVEFVRRVYFDLIGKPPTPEEFLAFLHDRSRDKRARLIDALLNSPDWARNWAQYWRDVVKFHATNENLARVRFDELEGWLAGQLRANRPWDEIAARLITATGRTDENGAVAFPLAYEAQPVEMAGEVSRIFLGVQIQCAQCHDHKTDAWKRRQFHEFAAFFAGAKQQPVVRAAPGQLPVFAVMAQPRVRYTMPDKENPARQIPIAPRFFLTRPASSQPEPALPESMGAEQRRALVASYITGQDNPWFAKAFINRTWYALMGEAFYEPIDDLGPERTPRAPEVLEPLASQWQRGGYDIRWLFRTLLNTQAYQRRVRSTANPAGKTPFASGCPSRLRADQVLEALAQALALPRDADGHPVFTPASQARPGGAGPGPGQGRNAPSSPGGPRRPAAGNPAQAKGKAAAQKAAAATGLASQIGKKPGILQLLGGQRLLFERLFGVDPSVANEDVTGTIPQALFMMNSQLIHSWTQARPGTVLAEVLAMAPNERAALNALYVRVLSRQPTSKELEICRHYLAAAGDPREAFEDIYWSLINTTEFITRR
jgi:hypothetical protein